MSLSVVLVGYGEQARRFYHPTLDALSATLPVRLPLVIDLADRADAIDRWLANRVVRPDRVLLLDPRYREAGHLAPEAEAALDELYRAGQLDRLLVIAEPKAHKPYVLWGVRNSVDVLCEKPLTAVADPAADPARAARLYEDYLEIARSIQRGRVVLMAHRRLHQGFRTVVEYLREFIDRFEVPVTYVDGYHAEGVWNMPDEFFTRENHPYRYGYGKLLHSGYHYVELATRVARLNAQLPDKSPDELVLTAQSTGAYDFFGQFDDARYRELLGTDRFDALLAGDPDAARRLGETDVQVMGQYRRDGRVITNLLLSLLHTSANIRFWNELPGDLRRNGRLPHERLTVHIAHLLTIEVFSRYTAPEQAESGPDNPFVIDVTRNARLVGGEPYERIVPGDGNAAHLAESARQQIVSAWLTGEKVDAELTEHGHAVQLLSAIYASLAARRHGGDATRCVPLR
jgi:predicted dehydrogenase